MHHLMRSAFGTVIVLLVLADPAVGQRAESALAVRVTASDTRQPLAGVRVRVGDLPARLTDAEGHVRIPRIPSGSHIVELTVLGYGRVQAIVTFEAGGTAEMEVEMHVQPVEIEGITATSWGRNVRLRDNGFYERQRRASGTFLTRDDLERRNLNDLVEAFRGVRGFSVVPNTDGPGYILASSRGSTDFSGTRCRPAVYLDGILLPPEEKVDPLTFIPVHAVMAIEAYSGPATVPIQFGGLSSPCGAVAIWTG
jgi:hypothetical protein